jgi:hypothetical protein
MQRLAVLALCAIVALATVWLLARPQAPTDGRAAAAHSASEGSLAPSPSGAGPHRPRDSALGGSGSAGGFAARGAAGSSATQDVGRAASGAVTEAARSDAQPSAQHAAPGFEGRAPITPQDVHGWARAPAQRQTGAATELESAEASPGEASAHASEGGVLSAEEIARRVDQLLPDGSQPPEALARARQLESQRILERSRLAAALVQPRVQEPNPDASSQQPAVALPPASPPAQPAGSMSTMSGTGNGAAR